MRNHFTGFAIATLLVVAPALPGHAEDAAPPPPVSVPRPSIAPPKTAEPAPAPVADDAAPPRHRRYARHHYRHYAYWQPFPIYLPHFYRQRIYWSRISWFAF